MKNLILSVLSVFTLLLNSCEVVYDGPQGGGGYGGPRGPQGPGGYYPPHQGPVGPHQGFSPGQQQQVTHHKVGENCYLKIGGHAPLEVVQAVENRARDLVQGKFSDSCFAADGRRGTWPTLKEVECIVETLFKQKGYPLCVGQDKQPGCFKVMEYRPDLKGPDGFPRS